MQLKTEGVNTELFIARKIIRGKSAQSGYTRPIVRIAVIGVALGLAVMILSVAIVTGFKNEIRNKVIGFGSHLQIVNYDNNYTFDTKPISRTQEFMKTLPSTPGIRHIQAYALKGGVIKTKDELQAVALKGIGTDFDWSFFDQNMVEGSHFEIPDTTASNQIVISKYLANLLKVKTGDNLVVYFIQQPPRMRKFTVSGVYRTTIEEFDKLFVLVDMRHIQKINGWTADQISGFEILVSDFDHIDDMSDVVFRQVGYSYNADGTTLNITSIKDRYPQIFSWLQLLDMNVWIILGLMVIVAGFNMISGILIMILERTTMIGILKSLGMKNWNIRKIFLYESSYLTIHGLLWGNFAGIGLCLLQSYTGWFRLEESTYYLSVVPVELNIMHILLLNLGTLVVTFAMLVFPSWIISRISPATTIRFD